MARQQRLAQQHLFGVRRQDEDPWAAGRAAEALMRRCAAVHPAASAARCSSPKRRIATCTPQRAGTYRFTALHALYMGYTPRLLALLAFYSCLLYFVCTHAHTPLTCTR